MGISLYIVMQKPAGRYELISELTLYSHQCTYTTREANKITYISSSIAVDVSRHRRATYLLGDFAEKLVKDETKCSKSIQD